jgi:hypothetical protein
MGIQPALFVTWTGAPPVATIFHMRALPPSMFEK